MSSALSLLILLAAGVGYLLAVRSLIGRRRQWSAYELQFPRDLDADSVRRFCVGLSSLLQPWWQRLVAVEPVVFEVAASGDRLRHHLLVPANRSAEVLAQLRAALPAVRVTRNDDYSLPPLRLARELQLTNFMRPLRTDDPMGSAAAILASLSPVDGETVVLQWLVAPATPRSSIDGPPRRTWWDELLQRGPRPAPTREERAKQAEPLFVAVGRIGVQAPSSSRAGMRLRQVMGALHVLNAPGVQLRGRSLPSTWVAERLRRHLPPLVVWPVFANALELVSLIAFPIGGPSLSGLRLGGGRQLPVSPLVPKTGRLLARSTAPGTEGQAICIEPRQRLRHTWLLGRTSSGKSTAIANSAAEDMQANDGAIVFDPTGDLVERCLEVVPAHRQRHVIVVDPTDDRPVGLNPLADARHDRELAVDQVTSIVRDQWAASWGPRTDDITRAGLLTLTLDPSLTLAELPLLLTSASWRRRLVAQVTDPTLASFWAWFDNISDAERLAATAPLLNKLRALLLRSQIRHVIGQSTPALNFDRVLADGTILLISLRRGLLGPGTADLLGTLVLGQLWQAILRRSRLAPAARRRVIVYLDEFASYAGLPVGMEAMLSSARGLGVGFVCAHQHTAQLTTAMRSALSANAGTKLTFGCGADDARVMAHEYAPYLTATDLQSFGRYELAASVAVEGQVAPPCTGRTEPPLPPTGYGAAARQWSRQQYGRDRADIEAELRTRQAVSTCGTVGRKRRSI